MILIASTRSPILVRSSLRTKIAPTTYLCALLLGSLLKKNLLLFSILFLYKMFDKPTAAAAKKWPPLLDKPERARYNISCPYG